MTVTKKVYALENNIVLKKIKEKEQETKINGVIIPINKTPNNHYEIINTAGKNGLNVGDVVCFKGYPCNVELDGEQFCVVAEDDIIAVIR